MSTQAIKLVYQAEHDDIFEAKHSEQLYKLKMTETKIEGSMLMQNNAQLN